MVQAELGAAGNPKSVGIPHCCSLNASFVRFRSLKGREFGSRGCWWTVHPDYRKAYGPSVLRPGPQHRCLPRTGPKARAPGPVPDPASIRELEGLEADLRAAATICALRYPLFAILPPSLPPKVGQRLLKGPTFSASPTRTA